MLNFNIWPIYSVTGALIDFEGQGKGDGSTKI